MSFLVVANFKSNLTQDQVKTWIAQVKPTEGMVVAPSFPHLSLIPKTLTLAAQDVSPFPPGSYTGAVSARELKDQGVAYCIIGHSERRRYFHESSSDVASKARELVAIDIAPILCMDTQDIVPQFAALDSSLLAKCIYCFEPQSSIGGSSAASLQDIQGVQQQVLSFVPGARFMYGGSVKVDNIKELTGIGLSGVLVASASLDPLSFNTIATQSI